MIIETVAVVQQPCSCPFAQQKRESKMIAKEMSQTVDSAMHAHAVRFCGITSQKERFPKMGGKEDSSFHRTGGFLIITEIILTMKKSNIKRRKRSRMKTLKTNQKYYNDLNGTTEKGGKSRL
jgi:hypothetical protein